MPRNDAKSRVLDLVAPDDRVLGLVSALAAAVAAGDATVVDLDPEGPRLGGGVTLAELVARGPRRDELTPTRRGVAIVANGGIEPADAAEVVAALRAAPRPVVFRHPVEAHSPSLVLVRPLVPDGLWHGERRSRVVLQDVGWRPRPAPAAPVLPRPRPGTVQALLTGRRPGLGVGRRLGAPGDGRWLQAWGRVWEWGR